MTDSEALECAKKLAEYMDKECDLHGNCHDCKLENSDGRCASSMLIILNTLEAINEHN